MPRNPALLAFLLALASGAALVSGDDQGWQDGRATWFDVSNGDLRTANCHMSWEQTSTGTYVAALSDTDPLFPSSCGMCIELRCENAIFKDAFGNTLDRSNACYDPSKVTTVTVADACPCNYPDNAESNRRWCCGDDANRRHIDITRNVFESLSNLNYGVIGLKWRVVDCSSRQVLDSGSSPASSAGSMPPSNSGSSALSFPQQAGFDQVSADMQAKAQQLKDSLAQAFNSKFPSSWPSAR